MTQKVKVNKQLRTARTGRRSRRLAGLLVVAMLTLGLTLSAANAPRVSGSVGYTLDIAVASVARLSVRVSAPSVFCHEPAKGALAEGAGVYLRLTLLQPSGIESINHSL